MNRRDTFQMLLARAGQSPASAPGNSLRDVSSRWWHRCRLTAVRLAAWLKARHRAMVRTRTEKRMRVVENVPLGERRFVALLRVDEREFLIAASGAGVSLLQELKQPAAPKKAEAADDAA